MKAATYLRIASVLTFIHAVLHTIGGVFGKPMPGVAREAFTVMQSHHFVVMGVSRTYAAFYVGLGLGATIFMTAEAILLWQLAGLVPLVGRRLRPLLWVLLVSWLAMAVNSWAYFFMGPVVAEILIAACLGGAIYAARPAAQ
jgi:hypothetical protein